MPVVASTRPQTSTVLKSHDSYENVNSNFATVLVKTASGTVTANPLGLTLIWDAGLSAFRQYLATDNSFALTSTLPNAAPIVVALGDANGIGFNTTDVTITTTGIYLSVIYRGFGEAELIEEGLVYAADVLTGDKAEFRTQLEKQGLKVSNKTPSTTSSYV